MSVTTQALFAISFGVLSTLPLGPSGLSIVSSFATKGIKKGVILLSALAIAEVVYLLVALALRAKGILELGSNIESLFTIIFGLFLLSFGLLTYRDSKKVARPLPEKFKTILGMSFINPSLIISYLALIILMDRTAGGQASGDVVVLLSSVFLSTVWVTIFVLGLLARSKRNLIKNNINTIKAIVGPLFMIVGITTVATTI